MHVCQIIYNFAIRIIFDSNYKQIVHTKVLHFISDFNEILNTDIPNQYLLDCKV
jgi:hypothetical protein